MYEKYPVKGHYGGQFDVYKQRNKVILGLMVYQGLSSGSIAQIELKDINLKKGTIHIAEDRKSTRLNSSHVRISYAVFCLKKKKKKQKTTKTSTKKQANKTKHYINMDRDEITQTKETITPNL